MYDHSFPACAFFFFFFNLISSRTQIPLFMPGSVYSSSASCDDCGRVFPDELRKSSFPDRFQHFAWTGAKSAHSDFVGSRLYACLETLTAVVWPCLPFIRSGQNHLARPSERGKKTRQTEEEVGRQNQGMDRPGVRRVQEGSGER